METFHLLSETESVGFFKSLLSQPRLLARTDLNSSPYRPMRRALAPVEDSITITRWTSALRQSLVGQLCRYNPPLSWTAFLPLQLVSRPYDWSDEPSNSDNYLFICAAPGTTNREQAARAAQDCLAVLREHGVTNMETLVAELEMVPTAGLPSLGEPKPQPEPEPVPVSTNVKASPIQEPSSETIVDLQDVFDPRFGSQSLAPDSSRLAAINEALLPFLPFPGQNIQPVDASDPAKDLPSGSLTCFLRLEDGNGHLSDTVYALASRHVAIYDSYDPHADFNCTSQKDSGNVPDIKIHTGAPAATDRQQYQLNNAQDDLTDWIHHCKKALFKNDSQAGENDRDIALLELTEECRNRYVSEVSNAMNTLGLRGESPARTQQVGHVAFAAGHGLDNEGFWKDWALIALPPASHKAQPGLFFTNKVYTGNWTDCVRSRARQMQCAGWLPDGYTTGTLDSIDDANFVNVQAPHPPMLMRSRTRVQAVVKRGPVTGLTVGLPSPIEAVVRRPFPGVDVIAWAWPVLSCVLKPDDQLKNIQFSHPGDAGSLVFDTDGVAVGMLDGGLGVTEKPRHTFQRQAEQAGSTAAAAATNSTASPQGGQTDITLITPIDAVFASIESVTGQTPRMV